MTTPFSYSADIYLTPAGDELRFDDREFRATHLVDVLYFWKVHHGHGDVHTTSRSISARALSSLAETHAGERWRVSVALGASETRPPPHDGMVTTTAMRASPSRSRARRDDGLRRVGARRRLRRTTMAEDLRHPVFELHIRPMFRLLDREHMLTFVEPGFDLWELERVWEMRNDILVRLRGEGSQNMPGAAVGGPWPPEWIDLFERWTQNPTADDIGHHLVLG